MGRMTFEEAMKYENEPCYFTLTHDGDTATVKFLFDSMKDIYQYLVHSVRYNGKFYKVECPRISLDVSEDKCPICSKGSKPFKKFYIPLYNLTEDKFQYWERGKTFAKKLIRLCEEYYPVSDHVFEIERVGEKGSVDTDYKIVDVTYEYTSKRNAKQLDFTLNDLDVPDCMDEEAGIVIHKSIDDLQFYVDNDDKFEDDTFDYDSRNRRDENIADRYNRRRNSFSSDTNNNTYRTRQTYSTRKYNNESYDNEEENEEESRTFTPRRREF